MPGPTLENEGREALARVIFGFGPNEPISRQKINRKRTQLALAWNPTRVPQKQALHSKILILADRCYNVLLPKAKDLPEPEARFVGNLIKKPVRFPAFKVVVAIASGLILILVL
ncbi:MAG: hypothetical protein AAB527_03725 [Patescibacteria group bacterium]